MKHRLPETVEWTVAELMSHNPGMTYDAARCWMSKLCREGYARVVVRGNIHHVARYARASRPAAAPIVLRTTAATSVFHLGLR